MRLYTPLVLFLSATLASQLPETKRGLADAFDPFAAPPPLQETHLERTTERAPTTVHLLSQASSITLSGLLSSLDTAIRPKETSTASLSQTTTASLSVSSSPNTARQSSISSIRTSSAPTPTYSTISSPSTTKLSGGQSITRGSQEWKIIGVAVIAFSAVAAILLLSVFFDQCWGFIRDLVWRKKRKDPFEELMPDWEKASWEIGMDGDGHRYPAMPPPAKYRASERDKDLDMEKNFNDSGITRINVTLATPGPSCVALSSLTLPLRAS